MIALTAPKKLPRVLSPVEVQTILDRCDRLRDRLLFAVLYATGHSGEALGLRHNDIAAAEREVTIRVEDTLHDVNSQVRDIPCRRTPDNHRTYLR